MCRPVDFGQDLPSAQCLVHLLKAYLAKCSDSVLKTTLPSSPLLKSRSEIPFLALSLHCTATLGRKQSTRSTSILGPLLNGPELCNYQTAAVAAIISSAKQPNGQASKAPKHTSARTHTKHAQAKRCHIPKFPEDKQLKYSQLNVICTVYTTLVHCSTAKRPVNKPCRSA